ncbi:serine-threonine protein kinase [Streptomyces sp. NPDC005303]|uniref:serine-threonine protein kinase n=1 Tax=Streptomyces sp. NPDC005303 TaxID=3155713 RepID=UPI0033A080F7
MAAVLAIAFTAFGYQLRPFIHQQFPAHSKQSDAPSAPSAPSSSPTPVVNGDVPQAYLGSWRTIINQDGEHTRSLVIKQGRIGDDVLILVADGPTTSGTYHCVFTAPLTAASSDGSELTVGPSTVTSGDPGICKPGGATTLTLTNGHTLSRTNSENGERLNYTR